MTAARRLHPDRAATQYLRSDIAPLPPLEYPRRGGLTQAGDSSFPSLRTKPTRKVAHE